MSATALREPVTRIAKQWRIRESGRILGVPETWDQLREVLVNLPKRARTPNTIVDLVSPKGDTLSVGIAGPSDKDNPGLTQQVACMNFVNASRNPPYLTAVGDASLTFESGGVVVFRYEEGTWTEILRRNCVPVEKMLEVVQFFYETGLLPDWMGWEEV